MQFEVVDSLRKLHSLFLSHFGGSSPESIRLHGMSATYRCPNAQCASNEVGHHSYGKNKLAVSFELFKHHCWICNEYGNVTYLARQHFSPQEYAVVNECANIMRKHFDVHVHSGTSIIPSLSVIASDESFELLAHFGDDATRKLDLARTSITRYAIKGRELTYDHIFFYKLMFARKGRFSGALIIPSYSLSGELNYFVGRRISPHEGQSKYVNPQVPKKDIIFNEHLIDWSQPLMLVEGPIDYLKLHGYNRTILFGSQLIEDGLLFKKLKAYKTPIKLLLDPDALRKSYDVAERLMDFGIPVAIATPALLNRGIEDAGQLTQDNTHEVVRDILDSYPTSTNRLELLNNKLDLVLHGR